MRTKVLSVLLLFACAASLFAGCRRTGDNTQASTIRFLNFKPEVATVYDEIAAAYKKEKGVTVIVETAASGNYESTLTAKMAGSEAPTIFQINGPKGYANWKDYCADLKDTELYNHLTDKDLAIKVGNDVYGIPYVIEGYGIIYNKEITDKYFALADKSTNYSSMDEIKSFDALKAIVEDMQSKKDKLGIQGVFSSTSLKTGEDWRWQTHLANLPVYYEFDDKDVDLSSDDTKEITFAYSDNFRKIFDLYLNNSVTDKKQLGSKIVDESMAEFALGKSAMVQNGNWAWSQISGISGNVVKEENIKFLPIYMGTEDEENQGLAIGTENFFCINSKASEAEQKAAADFLYWLYSSDTGKDFVTNKLDFIAPFDTFEDGEKPTDPLALEVLSWMNKEDIETIPWNFTVFPSQNFKDAFGAALLQYAQGTKSWQEVRDLMVSKWKSEAAAAR
ncbi:MAG: extracellular solute-binding protein [Clostridia bacterium]|nr:extracellular solute-binding protein [Clostridia bacterium]